MFGISVYPSKQSTAECVTYIDKAADLGYQRLFTSLIELEGDPEETIARFKTVIHHAMQR